MITSLEIENFKAVGSPGIRVQLRPITLLFGPNSIGKSTIIQALQYTREVLLHGKPNIDRTQLGGESVDLGGFASAVHRRELRRAIKIRLSVDCRAEVFPMYADAEQGEVQETELRQLLTGGFRFSDREPIKPDRGESRLASAWVEVTVGWDELEKAPRIMSFAVGWDGIPFVRVEARVASTAPAILVNRLHPLLEAARDGDSEGVAPLEDVRTLVEEYLRPPDSPAGFGPAEEWWEGQLSALAAIPERGRRLSLREFSSQEADDLLTGNFTLNPEEEARRRVTRYGLVAMTAAVLTPLEIVLRHLIPLRYVGPLRQVPDRDFRPCLTPTVERWSEGLGAWDALHLGPISLVASTSEWLGGKEALDTGYYLERREVIELDAGRFRELARRGELVDAIGDLEHEILTTRPANRLALVELRTGIRLEPRDLGVGISQVVPVVVATLATGSSIVAIEQPELHVHPSVQVGLGKLIVQTATDEDHPVTLLLETHSEHIALVILRQIEKTAGSSLADGEKELRTEDVAFHSIAIGGDGALQVALHEVNGRGDFETSWPGGFFDERGKVLFE